MSGFVVDASVSVKWVVHEEGTEAAHSLMGEDLAAPSLWLAECANVLWAKARRQELTRDEAFARQQLLRSTPLTLVPLASLIDRATHLAHDLDVTVYDATYLALALDLGIPLVTADQKLCARCDERMAPTLSVIDLRSLAS